MRDYLLAETRVGRVHREQDFRLSGLGVVPLRQQSIPCFCEHTLRPVSKEFLDHHRLSVAEQQLPAPGLVLRPEAERGFVEAQRRDVGVERTRAITCLASCTASSRFQS